MRETQLEDRWALLTGGRVCSPDVKCIVHLHTPATVAVSCLKQGFRCLAQESAYFHKKVAYHTWEGISDDSSGATCTWCFLLEGLPAGAPAPTGPSEAECPVLTTGDRVQRGRGLRQPSRSRTAPCCLMRC